jgi:S-adenosylhomocysteine hydrolase
MTADRLQTRNGIDFAVADLSLHEFGRKEIRLAEQAKWAPLVAATGVKLD